MWLYNKKFIVKSYPAFACGACLGRGEYIYHFAYDDCDCGGYETACSNPVAQGVAVKKINYGTTN